MTFKDIWNNWIVRNLLIAFAIAAVLLISASVFLRSVTNHNEELEVPDFYGMSVKEARACADDLGIRVEVVDSIYVKRIAKGSVVRQEPKAGAKVKTGRRVQLAINAVNAKQIPMPNLVGYSLRSANAELSSRGLELGKLIYVSDMATNTVLRQLHRNREIAPGKMIDSESRVDLVLGLNPKENFTSVPVLYGTKFKNALEKIHDHSLNVGTVRFDREIRSYQDSVNAMVYRQTPDPLTDLDMGSSVSIYLTLDVNKVPNWEYLQEQARLAAEQEEYEE